MPLARHLARRYYRHGHQLDDLAQVAAVGLLKAIDRFDPTRGTEFAAFATPTIAGELKRYFRDSSWAVHVPRGLQELALEVRRAADALERELGRPPTAGAIAERTGMPLDRVATGHDVIQARYGVPLERVHDDTEDDRGPRDAGWIGVTDDGFRRAEDAASWRR